MSSESNMLRNRADSEPVADDERSEPRPHPQPTLLDLRGSVPVGGEQDFEAIRRQVTKERQRRRADGGV